MSAEPSAGSVGLFASGSVSLADIPWPLLMALGSLGLIYLLFRRRAEAFADFGFSSREVALLCLGSVAGWAVNLPLVPLGESTYLAVNLGGALVPVLLVGWWITKRKLPIVRAFVGTVLVSFIAYAIVRFDPSQGIVAVFPWFFLPSIAALLFALVTSFPQPMRSVPIAYTAGSLGALLGADVYNFPVIADHFRTSPESTLVSIGGAGVFDMVFLAGTLAMATDLLIVLALPRRAVAGADAADAPLAYPVPPFEVRNGSAAWARYQELRDPSSLEESAAALALSDLALRDRDWGKSVRMSWLAVDALLREPGLRAAAEASGNAAFHHDVRTLGRAGALAREERNPLDRVAAGNANVTAKLLVGCLAPRAAGAYRLEARR